MVTKRRRFDLKWPLALLTGVLALVNGQGESDIMVTWASSYAFIEGKELYVRGGYTVPLFPRGVNNQMFSLDLSTPWNVSSPPFRKSVVSLPSYSRSMAITKDENTIVVFQDKSLSEFTIKREDWNTIPLANYTNIRGMIGYCGSAMDPITGKFYVPSSEVNGTGIVILEYDPSSRNSKPLPPIPDSEKWNKVAVIWSAALNRLIMFGRDELLREQDSFTTPRYWSPETGWGVSQTKGTAPTVRSDACIVPAYGGTKLLLFGGSMDIATLFSDIYILDLATMTWTQGRSAETGSGRKGMACAVTNDLFISWGGFEYMGPVKTNITLVYNMKTDAWQTNYSPEPFTDNSSTTKNGESTQKSSLGPIIGASVGGSVAIIGALGLCILLRRRKSQAAVMDEGLEQEVEADKMAEPDLSLATAPELNPPEIELTVRKPQTAAHGWGFQMGVADVYTQRNPEESGDMGQTSRHQGDKREHNDDLQESKSQRVGKEEYIDGHHESRNQRVGKAEYNDGPSGSTHSRGQSAGWNSRFGKEEYNGGLGAAAYPREQPVNRNARPGKAEYIEQGLSSSSNRAYGKEEYREGYDVEEDRINHPHFRSPFDKVDESRANLENDAQDPQHARGFGYFDSRGSVQPLSNKGPQPSQENSGQRYPDQDRPSRMGHKTEFHPNNGATAPSGHRDDPHALNGTFQAVAEPDTRNPEYVSARHAPFHNNDNYWYHSSSAAFSNAANGSRGSKSATTKTDPTEQSHPRVGSSGLKN